MRFRIEAYNRDSSAVIFDMTSLFMGKEKALNPVPKQVGQYGITSQPQSNLSFLGDIKAFDDNLSIETCMTYDFTLKYAMFSMPIGNDGQNNQFCITIAGKKDETSCFRYSFGCILDQ